jgi:hypothetical protein
MAERREGTTKPEMMAGEQVDTGFPRDTEVDVKEVDETNWELLKGIEYMGKKEPFHVPSGMTTDFASVPRVFVWFLPRYGRYTKAAIVHDYLWRERASKGTMSYIDADAIFRRALRQLGVPFLRRWILWTAVRWGALVKKGGTRQWWKESWRVLLVTFIALPIVLPPAIAILVFLLVFLVEELVVWLALRVWAFFQKSMLHRPAVKRVNMPRLTWKM